MNCYVLPSASQLVCFWITVAREHKYCMRKQLNSYSDRGFDKGSNWPLCWIKWIFSLIQHGSFLICSIMFPTFQDEFSLILPHHDSFFCIFLKNQLCLLHSSKQQKLSGSPSYLPSPHIYQKKKKSATAILNLPTSEYILLNWTEHTFEQKKHVQNVN